MNASIIHQSVPTPVCKQTPVSVATPDGGLLYTGFKCINYVAAPPTDGKHDIAGCGVKTMSTRITVNALDVSPLWGKIKNKSDGSLEKHGKHFATVAEDLSVQVWDCEVGEVIIGHKAHQHQHEARDVRVQPLINVMLSYMANGNILSIDASDLVIYCIASNSYCRRPTFVSPRNHQLTALRCSPYDENLFALGTAAGTVLICDLLKMSIVYKLSSHGPSASICSLAWREMSTIHGAIEEKKPEHDADKKIEQWRNSANAASKAPLLKSKATEADEPFDIYNFDHLESEFGAPAKVRSQRHSKSSDDVGDFVGLEKPTSNVNLDFMEACENMKADLRAQRTQTQAPPQMEVTLQDCQQSDVQCPRSDSESHNSQKQEHSESTEGSLELLQYSSSSDDAVIVDGEAPKPKREVLHHIYHQAEVHDAPESPQLKAAAQPAPVAASTDSLDKFSTISSKKPDMLLVSINANDVVQVWNANTGGHCAKNYNKSNATGKDKQVHWLSDQSIVCLSRQQLVFYMLEYDCKTHRYKIQKDQKLKCVAQDILTMSANTANQHIWLNLASRRVCSMNPRTGQFITLYGCLPLGVRAIAECPDDMNKIALGCSDKRLALFDISKLSTHCIQIDSLSVNSAVYALCWSPDCLELAYGTHDGIVGILNVERMKVKTTFRVLHKREVYSLVWQDNYIYFIADRELGIYDVTQPNKAATVLRNLTRPSYICVRGSFLFVGTEDGFLQLYERQPGAEQSMTALRQITLLARYVTDIAFNPLQRQQFAVAGHDKLLHVLEFKPQERNWNKLHTFTCSDAKASITSLKWSNLQSHLLLSFHIEGKVCLWNTQQPQQPPLTITYHCPMWCGLFLPYDENIILCSGKSLSLEFVNIRQALANNDKTICCKIDALLKVKWANKTLVSGATAGVSAAQKKRQRRNERKAHAPSNEQPALKLQQQNTNEEPTVESLLATLSLGGKSNVNQLQMECQKCKESQALQDNFLAHSRTCLCLTQRELNKQALDKLAIVLTEDAAQIDKSVLMSKLFSTKVMAKELIAAELTNLKQSNNKDIAPLCLSVATFKVREEIEQHIENKTLNEWHLSVAPAVSYVFWQKVCKAYAAQLEQQGFILHAATYLMAIDLQADAINLLLKHEYFREALAYARIHLPATDAMIKTIINKWLEQLEKTGNFAAAALICVLDNEMLRGYSYLRKFRNCTPEIADLMEQIKRIGQLGALFDDNCVPKGEQPLEEAA